MKLPYRERAIIAPEKMTAYMLNLAHWQQLEADIRRDHLKVDTVVVRTSRYGVRYDIRVLLQTPSERQLHMRRFGISTNRFMTGQAKPSGRTIALHGMSAANLWRSFV